MDPFLLYLIAINAVTFLAFVIDFHICMRWPAVDDSVANSIIMDVFPIAGGALGMLLALFVITGTGRGHRMNKDNIAWWFLAIVCLIAWGLVAAVRFGSRRGGRKGISPMGLIGLAAGAGALVYGLAGS